MNTQSPSQPTATPTAAPTATLPPPAGVQAQLTRLYQHHVIDKNAYRYANNTFLPKLQWRRWIMRLSAGLGTILLLLGIVFFFAYNWHAMPKWSKLALLEGAMLVSFALATLLGIKRLPGQCLLLAGTVFIGVFFAVFGQIYQTGADAWQLFALWAVLMLGFVGWSRFPGQWILQWSVTGLALFLWMQQTTHWNYDEDWIPGLIIAFYTLGVWVLQMLLARRYRWLNVLWLRVLTVFIGHIWLLGVGAVALFDDNVAVFFTVMTLVAGLLWWHWQKGWDLLSQVIGAVTLTMLLWALSLYVSTRDSGDAVGIAVMMLMVTLGLSVGCYKAVIALKKQYADHHMSHHTDHHIGKRIKGVSDEQ